MQASVGVVVSIARYPVKSMRAEYLEAADLHWPWLHGDRQYAFVKAPNTSGFPWLTGRDLPSLVQYKAQYANPGDPAHSKVTVTDPDGAMFDIRDPALASRLAEAAGVPVWLLRLGRGCFDAMPVSILTTTMAEIIEEAHGAPVAIDRFRTNVVIRPTDPAVTEQDWLGGHLAFEDGAALDVGWATPRCAMVGIDAATGVRDASVVRTVVQRFQNRVGAYCAVRRPGKIQVGDEVMLTADR